MYMHEITWFIICKNAHDYDKHVNINLQFKKVQKYSNSFRVLGAQKILLYKTFSYICLDTY